MSQDLNLSTSREGSRFTEQLEHSENIEKLSRKDKLVLWQEYSFYSFQNIDLQKIILGNEGKTLKPISSVFTVIKSLNSKKC